MVCFLKSVGISDISKFELGYYVRKKRYSILNLHADKTCFLRPSHICILNKNSLAVKKVRGQSEATMVISDQKL